MSAPFRDLFVEVPDDPQDKILPEECIPPPHQLPADVFDAMRVRLSALVEHDADGCFIRLATAAGITTVRRC